MPLLNDGLYKPGVSVKWQDLVSGRTRRGVLVESDIVVGESKPLKDLYDDIVIMDIEKIMWTIKEDKTGKIFTLDTKQFEVVKHN